MAWGKFITTSLVIQWVVMVIIIALVFVLTRNFKEVPEGRQNAAETFVEFITKLVEENMGKECMAFIPFVGTIFLFLLFLNLTGLIGIQSPTADYSVALGFALISFVIVQAYTIKKSGIANYFLGYARPYFFLLPINLLERVSLPVSLSLRLFGNMFAASIIMDLVYKALRGLSIFAQFGIPIPLHLYFDAFDGTLQMIIFMMLTMVNIKVIAEE